MNEVHFDSPLHAEGATPFFSICIPQYNRTRFLIEGLLWVARQSFRDVEVVISDDRSTDGLEQELLACLRDSGLSFIYRRQEVNLRYDANLRTAIDMSRGRYCLLMGNDDRLASSEVLSEYHELIKRAGDIGVAITNFRDESTGNAVPRMSSTRLHRGGPDFAASTFRDFAFVSGIVLDGPRARAGSSDRWDGSEQYQMYLGSRIIASGGSFLSIDRPFITKDIRIPGQTATLDVTDLAEVVPGVGPINERRVTLRFLAPLVTDAVAPYTDEAHAQILAERALRQVLLVTYPYWIFEHRRNRSRRFALEICLGMRPRVSFVGFSPPLTRGARMRLRALYLAASVAALLIPLTFFESAKPKLYRLVKADAFRSVAR